MCYTYEDPTNIRSPSNTVGVDSNTHTGCRWFKLISVYLITHQTSRWFWSSFWVVWPISYFCIELFSCAIVKHTNSSSFFSFAQGSRDYFGITVLWSHRHVVPRLCDSWTFSGLASLSRGPGVWSGKQPYPHPLLLVAVGCFLTFLGGRPPRGIHFAFHNFLSPPMWLWKECCTLWLYPTSNISDLFFLLFPIIPFSV